MPPVQLPARRALFGALLAAAIALATGCSDDDPVREDQPVVRVTLDEYAITPQDISVPSGEVELVARNIGRLTHNLQIEIPPGGPRRADRDARRDADRAARGRPSARRST